MLLLIGASALTGASQFVIAFFSGWFLMLLFGVLHINVSQSVPLIGYNVAYPIALLVGLLYWLLTLLGSAGGSD